MKILPLGAPVMLTMYVLSVGIENKGSGRRCISPLPLSDVAPVTDGRCNIQVCYMHILKSNYMYILSYNSINNDSKTILQDGNKNKLYDPKFLV